MIYEFYTAIFFFVFVMVLSSVLIILSDFLVEDVYDSNKNAVYECGFQPIDLNLQQFDVKFYVVGLLFLIFDVEIAFFLPLISSGHSFICYNTFIAVLFVNCFFLTFVYEWKNDFLDWS